MKQKNTTKIKLNKKSTTTDKKTSSKAKSTPNKKNERVAKTSTRGRKVSKPKEKPTKDTKNIIDEQIEIEEINSPNMTLKTEFIFVLILILSLFLLISMHTNSTGIVGTSIKEILLGLFSTLAYIIPYFLFAIGIINMISKLNDKRKNLNIALTILFIIALLVQGITNIEYIKDKVFSPVFMIESFSDAISLKGSGIVGNSISMLLYKPIGIWGFGIVLGLAITSFLIFAFKIKPTAMVENVGIKAVNTTKNINESIKNVVVSRENHNQEHSFDYDFDDILEEYKRNKNLRDKLDELKSSNVLNLELGDDFLYNRDIQSTEKSSSKPTISYYKDNQSTMDNLVKYEDLKYENMKLDELENEEEQLKMIASKNLEIYAKIEEIAREKSKFNSNKSYVKFKSKYPVVQEPEIIEIEINQSKNINNKTEIEKEIDLDEDEIENFDSDMVSNDYEIYEEFDDISNLIINKFIPNKDGDVYEKIELQEPILNSNLNSKDDIETEYNLENSNIVDVATNYDNSNNYDVNTSVSDTIEEKNQTATPKVNNTDRFSHLFNTATRQENARNNPYIDEKFNDRPEGINKFNPYKNSEETNDDIKLENNENKVSVSEEAQMIQLAYENYKLPSFDIFNDSPKNNSGDHQTEIMQNVKKLEHTFSSFKIDAKVVNVSKGPMITRFEIQPSAGVKVSKIVSLSDDIALNLAATSVRIVAPIPGKAAIGIEIPNKITSVVSIKDVIATDAYKAKKSNLKFALGMDISGKPIVPDLASMPHLLIAGATGSGKSVCVNTIITSILCNAKPDEVKLLMIDPKVVELNMYSGIPHLILPVVTDPKKASIALNWAVQEMTERYNKFAEAGVKDIFGYNRKYELDADVDFMPRIVIIIDELSDLMMAAPNQVEEAICRIAQMARACGMHLIVATQRPSVDVITGLIKANIPSRIAFSVSSHVDSKTIIDSSGAEKLLGKGDMLYYPVGISKPMRVQGAFISEKEVENLVKFVAKQTDGLNTYDESAVDDMKSSNSNINSENSVDELLDDAIAFVIDVQKASASLMQRKFRIGYNRAARIVEEMEERGIVGASRGSKPREVLVKSIDELHS